MAGSSAGGAELFYERLLAALHRSGDTVLPVIRTDDARAGRLAAAGLAAIQLPFGGLLDLTTRPRLRTALRRFVPRLVMAWMNRAARFAPRGDWVLAGRLGGYYDLSYYKRCDHLVGNTRGIADWIRGQGWPAAKVHHLPNFVPDLAGAAPALLPVPSGAPVVLALGRLHRNKAFDVLVRAMRRLPGVHAAVAGTGPEAAALDALARGEGVADRVHWLGWRTDQAALLAACEALAVPSRHEPLGNVVIEGFSAARPVVAAAADGPRELVRSGMDGMLVPPDDPAALAEALGAVLGDRGVAERLGRTGRARYEAEFAEAPVLARWRAGLARMAAPGPSD